MSEEYKDEGDRKPGTVTVFHSSYGCDTGCMGHRIAWDGDPRGDRTFTFGGPFNEDHLEWAKQLVREELGEEHVKDLDWDNCWVSEDW